MLQYETSQAARDSKSSPRSVQPQAGPSPHPSPLRLEQSAAGGHDVQSHPHQGLKTSSSEPLIVKSPADTQVPNSSPVPVTMTKVAEEARASGDKVTHTTAADGELAADAEKKKQ